MRKPCSGSSGHRTLDPERRMAVIFLRLGMCLSIKPIISSADAPSTEHVFVPDTIQNRLSPCQLNATVVLVPDLVSKLVIFFVNTPGRVTRRRDWSTTTRDYPDFLRHRQTGVTEMVEYDTCQFWISHVIGGTFICFTASEFWALCVWASCVHVCVFVCVFMCVCA